METAIYFDVLANQLPVACGDGIADEPGSDEFSLHVDGARLRRAEIADSGSNGASCFEQDSSEKSTTGVIGIGWVVAAVGKAQDSTPARMAMLALFMYRFEKAVVVLDAHRWYGENDEVS